MRQSMTAGKVVRAYPHGTSGVATHDARSFRGSGEVLIMRLNADMMADVEMDSDRIQELAREFRHAANRGSLAGMKNQIDSMDIIVQDWKDKLRTAGK